LAAIAVAAGLGAGAFTGAGAAFADDRTASPGGTDTAAAARGGEDPPASEEPSTLPPGVRISNRTLERLSRTGEMESLRLQMAMNRHDRLMTTLKNVLEKSSDTAQNVVDNIK
jgi:hypothetical protein